MGKGFFWVVPLGVLFGLVGTGGREPSVPPVETKANPAGEVVLDRRSDGHFYATALVNGQPVQFLVDTGATGVALTVADATRIGLPISPSSFAVIGEGAAGPVRGQLLMLDRVSVGGKEVQTVRGAVLEGSGLSLLGQSYLSRLSSVQIAGDYMTLR